MNICMLAYTFYETDNRVMRYAETLVKHGHRVDVIALSDEGRPAYERMNGVHVYRIQKRVLDEHSSLSYAKKLLKFLLRAAWFLARRTIRSPYDLVHVHNIPDFLVFAALAPKLRGAKIILDIHDLVPELYASKFQADEEAWHIRLLKHIEKMSAAFADFVIVANDLWHERLCERTVRRDKIMTIMNYPDLEIFRQRPPKQPNGKFVVIYPGTLSSHQGLDIVVQAFDLLRDRLPHAEFHIYGDGHEKPKLIQMAKELGLQERILLKGTLPLREIYDAIAQADLGVEPKRNNGFSGEAFSTKIPEFMAVGIPVVASETRVAKWYFNDDMLCFFTSGDAHHLAASIVKVHDDHAYREQLVRNAFDYIAKNNWSMKQMDYLQLLERLTEKRTLALEADKSTA